MKKILITVLLLSGCGQNFNEKVRAHLSELIGDSLTNSLLGEAPVIKREINLPAIPDYTRDGKTFGGFLGEEQINVGAISKSKMSALNLQYIKETYKEVRGINASDSDLRKWANALNQGGTREGLYRSLVLDTGYYKLERKNIPLTDSSIDFATYFSKKYMGKEFSAENLERINFYRLKRELTDRSLEIVDALSANIDEVYDWYAVFSVDLATKYPKIWKFKIRKNKSPEFQRRWAKGVPVQMMKSEIILKLNRLINLLNK